MGKANRPIRARRPRRAWSRQAGPLAALGLLAAAVLTLRTLDLGSPRRGPPAAPEPQVVAALEPAPRPTEPVSFEAGCASAECHGPMLERPHVHETAAEQACDLCHAADAGDHTFPLVEQGEALCTRCHSTGGTDPIRHGALAAGSCLDCHDPHGSASPFMLTGGTVAATCATCHPTDPGPSRHRPYQDGDCAACHEPHGSRFAGLLRGGEGAEHCAMCHGETIAAMASSRHSHAGVEGECAACHGAHATRSPALMLASVRESCTSCHEEVGQQAGTALFSHDAVLEGDQCLSCHAPHGSDRVAMLRDDLPGVCLGCHGEAVTASDGRTIPAMDAALAGEPFIHGPVAEGDCAACHNVHGASHARLLREINPGILIGAYDIHNYALCFSCHDQALALEDETTATEFREGTRNLHKAHLSVNGRARGCADCHSVHTGTQPRLIVERIAYDGSDWVTPMNFVLTTEGGSCAPGCHEPLGYRRDAAVDAPPAQEGGAP